MTLNDVKRILRKTTIDNYNKTEVRLSPVQRFEVFYTVCENLYKDECITKAQFERWTSVY